MTPSVACGPIRPPVCKFGTWAPILDGPLQFFWFEFNMPEGERPRTLGRQAREIWEGPDPPTPTIQTRRTIGVHRANAMTPNHPPRKERPEGARTKVNKKAVSRSGQGHLPHAICVHDRRPTPKTVSKTQPVQVEACPRRGVSPPPGMTLKVDDPGVPTQRSLSRRRIGSSLQRRRTSRPGCRLASERSP